MDYDFKAIEKKWIQFWKENNTYKVEEEPNKKKYYVLDMFPYPSGAGLHVGHPLGYIASDIFARYKKLQGFNVLHPMGYDSFGLPAEQYAIQTGQHPAITTEKNIQRYREQLDKMGFNYDWSREVRTSSPDYYRWTQWIFKQLFNSYYDITEDKAQPVDKLKDHFTRFGSKNSPAFGECKKHFTAQEWISKSNKEKEEVLQEFRLAFLSEGWVNWCPELGTVLANDEVVNGLSERGGFPVEQKKMTQWSMRIKAYADRLLSGLDALDWTDSIKEQQRNWIGKSKGSSVFFHINKTDEVLEVFTTRPDTIFGVTFIVIAPEHPLAIKLAADNQLKSVTEYIENSKKKSERERQAETKNISGVFTGSYAIHPFTKENIPIWIGDYVLASYGTGAVMSVPCGDQRDYDFAKYFSLPIVNVFENVDVSEEAYGEKHGKIANSDFLNGLEIKAAIDKAILEIENRSLGEAKTNYRLRDAVFSRQRYWGEPFPVFYQEEIPKVVEDDFLPIQLPEVDAYLPTKTGEPPLARADKSSWNYFQGDRMEYNTMPGWAGSSWYFLRYMDPKNNAEFVSKEKVNYWQNVDLYIGGSEHATGHLLYARFWTKFLYDAGFLPFDEPFKKMINQGMILGRSSFVHRVNGENTFVSADLKYEYSTTAIHVDISLVDNDKLDITGFKNWRKEFQKATFICNGDKEFLCSHEVEKMSKSKYNVQTPDELIDKFGADTLRMYEMFLGPIEQSKPWDTKGITGVHGFLKKTWRLFHMEGTFNISEEPPTKEELRTLHKTIKKVKDDLDRYSFNTVVSTLMIAVNELSELNCTKKEILSPLVILLSPYAPHISEELWAKLGNKQSINEATFPEFDEKHLLVSEYEYPVSFNGKMRFKLNLSLSLTKKEIEDLVLENELSKKWMEGRMPKKTIVVPGKIINIVF